MHLAMDHPLLPRSTMLQFFFDSDPTPNLHDNSYAL
jgi:hypothetical protein